MIKASLRVEKPKNTVGSNYIPYSWKIRREIKFGSLAVYVTTAKLKSAKLSYSHIWRTCTELPNSNNNIILEIAILGSNAKFNFRLNGSAY